MPKNTSNILEGFCKVWEDSDWISYQKDEITLYFMKDDQQWQIAVHQAWMNGVYSTAEEALKGYK